MSWFYDVGYFVFVFLPQFVLSIGGLAALAIGIILCLCFILEN